MRTKLALIAYLAFVEVVSYSLVVLPASAFQVSALPPPSTSGYVRVIPPASTTVFLNAAKTSALSSVASAATTAGAGALALRFVAGGGWVGLGISAGLLLYEMYYSQAELDAIRTGATPPASYTVPGYAGTGTVAMGSAATCPVCASGWAAVITITTPAFASNPFPNFAPAWASQGVWNGTTTSWPWVFTLYPAYAATNAPVAHTVAPTTQQIRDYVATLPASNVSSIETNTTGVGVGGSPNPTTAPNQVTSAVDATSVTTQVVPASQVQPTDVVVDPNATKPAGTVTNTSTTQTTTTTTVNPDGSTTKQETDSAPASCAFGTHELRTFGGILQEHLDLWKGSGLLSALNLLKTLTWPTTIPTYSLQSNLLGTFTLDFSVWSGMLTAIRSIVIAVAGFVAYKIVFVGAR